MSEFEDPGSAEASAWLDGTDLRHVMNSEAASPEVQLPDTRTPMQIVNVRLPVELVESMDGLAADRGGQRSELIRAALAQYLERETGPVPGAEAEYALEVLQRVVRRNNAA